jgi:ribonuclease R
MNKDSLTEDILRVLHENPGGPPTASELSGLLALRGAARKRLQKYLVEMVREGSVVQVRGNRYSLGEQVDLVTAPLSVARSGRGFVETADGLTVRIESDDLGTALPGDRVVVRLNADDPPGAETRTGRVVRILDRVRRDIVGTVRAAGSFLCVVPIEPSYRKDFYVTNASAEDVGKRVVIRFTNWANRHVNPEGEVIEVLGVPERVSDESIAAIRHFQLREEFPAEVVHEAERASVLMDRPGPRLDIRDMNIITIDPERARDFDDALSLHRDGEGNRVLGVHIADVSHFVEEGGPLDVEARERGNSTYLPDRVLPMLPEQLSNGICSLNPNVDRLAFSAFLTIDGAGAVIRRAFARTLIRSRRRLTYAEAQRTIADDTVRRDAEPTERLIRVLHALAAQIRARRFAADALDLGVPECEIAVSADGMIEGIRPVIDDESHHLVEECMVLANEAVAEELKAAGLVFISRRHDPPSASKICDLEADLQVLGFKCGQLRNRRRLAAFLASIREHPLAHHARVAVLRSMMRAEYNTDSEGHYGLAKSAYAHFTSPIRRYPDLTLHRVLGKHIASGRCMNVYRPEDWSVQEWAPGRPAGRREQGRELGKVAAHCSETEYVSEQAERMVDEIMKYRYLAQQVESDNPRVFETVVVRAMNFGLFVEIPELQVQGLIHVSMLSDSFVQFNRRRGELSAGSAVYRVGSRLSARPVAVDFDARKVDFAPVGMPVRTGTARAVRPRRTGAPHAGARRKSQNRSRSGRA